MEEQVHLFMQESMGVIDVAKTNRALALVHRVVVHDGLRDEGSAADPSFVADAIIRRTLEDILGWPLSSRIGRPFLFHGRFPVPAEQALNTALRLAPDPAETQFDLGVARYLQGNYRGAEAMFRRATVAKPNYAPAHDNLGHCLLQKGDRDEAIEPFCIALCCQADYAEAHTAWASYSPRAASMPRRWRTHGWLCTTTRPTRPPSSWSTSYSSGFPCRSIHERRRRAIQYLRQGIGQAGVNSPYHLVLTAANLS
jgi:tetratricopeptide (TPR) repeat protein